MEKSNTNITDCFIHNLMDFAASIDDNVYRHIQNCFLDYLGCAWGGTTLLGTKVEMFINDTVGSAGKSEVFGQKTKYGATIAAFANGMFSHALEMDDGQRVGTMHLAAPVFSGLLAIAEQENITYDDFLKGAAVGYETAIRLACSIQPYHKKRGFHTTGTCGTIGVAMAVATALHANFDQYKSTLSAAVSSAAGVLEMLADDSELKPYNVGRAASDGLLSAYIGKCGFVSPNDALMGKRGFYATMTDKYDLSYVLEFEKYPVLCTTTFFKPYAACRHCHPAIEAALALTKQQGIVSSKIKAIKVKTYDLAIVGHDHQEAKSVNSAKMSIPYSVAVAVIQQRAGIQEFDLNTIAREDIAGLAKKVTVEEDPSLSALIPDKRAAIVEIMTDETVYQKKVDVAKGEPENPMSREELVQKFCFLAQYAGRDNRWCDRAAQMIFDSSKGSLMGSMLPYLFGNTID